MGTKKLKKENEHLNISIIDILSHYDISKTNKYTQFLVRMLNQSLKGPYLNLESENETNKLFQSTDLKSCLIHRISERLIGYENLKLFVDFTVMMEKNIVEKKDISKYDSWDEIEYQYYLAINKQNLKQTKKEYKKIFEDETHLIIRPLNYNTSCTYGYQTKWCTASLREPEYFYRHSKGVLIYVINKKTNEKFGFYKELDSMDDQTQTSFVIYNSADYRIDSFMTGLPHDLLKLIVDELQTNTPNYKFFSNEELANMLKHVWIDERKILTRVQRHYRGDLDLDVLANLLPDQPVPLDEPILPRLSSEEKEFLVEQQRARLININSEL
jgi:hypothetical protein